MNFFKQGCFYAPEYLGKHTIFCKYHFSAQILYSNLGFPKDANFTDCWCNDHFPFDHYQLAMSKARQPLQTSFLENFSQHLHSIILMFIILFLLLL